jgi:hypothetical protein
MAIGHPLLRLAFEQPQLLVEHVSAYAELAADESARALARVARQLALRLVAGGSLAVAATLAGVSLMLWAGQAPGHVGAGWAPWAMVLVPLAPWLGVAWACGRLHAERHDPSLAALRAQAGRDMALWRASHAPPASP